MPPRVVSLLHAVALLAASQQGIIDLSEADKAFIVAVLDGHARAEH